MTTIPATELLMISSWWNPV